MTCRDLKPIAKYVYEAFEERKIMIDSLEAVKSIIDNVEKQEKATANIEAGARHVNRGHMTGKNSTSSSVFDKNLYAIRDLSSDGLKFTIHKKSYAIEDVSVDGLKFKITWRAT